MRLENKAFVVKQSGSVLFHVLRMFLDFLTRLKDTVYKTETRNGCVFFDVFKLM